MTPSPEDTSATSAKQKRPLWVRILLWSALALVVVVVGVVAYIAYLWWRVPSDHLDAMKPGTLTVDSPAATSATAGPFTVQVSPGDKAALTVTQGTTGTVVWRSDPGKPFLGASVGTVDYTEKFGYFWPDVKRTETLLDQTVSEVIAADGAVTIKGTVRGKNSSAPYTMTLTPVTKSTEVTALGVDVVVAPTEANTPVTSVLVTAGRDPGETVHGFGEQYRAFDLSGQVFPVLVQEQGIGRGQQPITFLADITNWGGGNLATTYAPWPTWVTGENRSFALTDAESSGALGIADLSNDRQIRYESWSPHVAAEALVADTPAALVSARAAGTTRPDLAAWTQKGAVLGLQGGTEKVRAVVAEMKAAGANISGVWLQDWVGKRQTSFGSQLWWTWQLDTTQYPGWDQLVVDLKAQGIEVTTYVNPFLADAAAKNDPTIRNLYAEAAAQGFLVKNTQGQPYVIQTVGFPVGLMDLTNPAARDWYSTVIATDVLGKGASGFMADFGEGLPFDAVVAEGNAAEQHNRYPELWAQTVRAACDKAGQPDCVAFMRSSYLKSPQYVPIMWAGDQMVDFASQDGLASTINAALSGGVSGTPLWHSDIGGYTSINAVVKNYTRPPELNARWGELQALGVMMRTHETNRPDVNQQVYSTPATRADFARETQIFAALEPYRATVLAQAAATGLPAMRHGWLVYPGTKAATVETQYFLGEHLLVAPVTAEGATTVKATLPPGTWVHVFSGQVYSGDTEVDVAAPIGTPAAFVKQGDPVGEQIRTAFQNAGLTTG